MHKNRQRGTTLSLTASENVSRALERNFYT